MTKFKLCEFLKKKKKKKEKKKKNLSFVRLHEYVVCIFQLGVKKNIFDADWMSHGFLKWAHGFILLAVDETIDAQQRFVERRQKTKKDEVDQTGSNKIELDQIRR